MTSPSSDTDTLAIVETGAWPVMTALAPRLRIVQSLTFLPSGSAVNRDPLECFQTRVVVRALRSFPQPGCLARATLVSRRT